MAKKTDLKLESAKQCSAMDEQSTPAIRCELPDGHEGDHQWKPSIWPESKGGKTFVRKFK
jgi:hypothetical protein